MSVEKVTLTPFFQALLSSAAFLSPVSFVPRYGVNGRVGRGEVDPLLGHELVVLFGQGHAVLDRPDSGLDGAAGALGRLHVAGDLEPALGRLR